MSPATEELLRRWREGKKKNPHDWDLAREMYARGATLKKIASAIGVSAPAVHEYKERHRWERGEPPPMPEYVPPSLPEGVDPTDLTSIAGGAISEGLTSIAKRATKLLPSEILQLQKIREAEQEGEDRKRARATRDGAPSLEWLTRRHTTKRERDAAFQKRLEAAGVTLDEVAGVLGRGGPIEEPNASPNAVRSKPDDAADQAATDEEPTSGEGLTPEADPGLVAVQVELSADVPAPEDVGRIAARAGVQVRTVTRAYKSSDVEEYLLVRVMQAAQALGLPPPSARLAS